MPDGRPGELRPRNRATRARQAHYNKASVLMSLGRIPESVGHFDSAIALDPSYAKAWFNKKARRSTSWAGTRRPSPASTRCWSSSPGTKGAQNRRSCMASWPRCRRQFAQEPSAPGADVSAEGQDWSAEGQFDEFVESERGPPSSSSSSSRRRSPRSHGTACTGEIELDKEEVTKMARTDPKGRPPRLAAHLAWAMAATPPHSRNHLPRTATRAWQAPAGGQRGPPPSYEGRGPASAPSSRAVAAGGMFNGQGPHELQPRPRQRRWAWSTVAGSPTPAAAWSRSRLHQRRRHGQWPRPHQRPRAWSSGRGMVNGRGLTTAGASPTARPHQRRGHGQWPRHGQRPRLTNGRGLTNGAGMVNGRGLTNGAGMVNGRGMATARAWSTARA